LRQPEKVGQLLTHGMTLKKILGGLAVAIVVAGVVAGFDDIRRYIRISTM
jgi:hypothetical protein